MEDSNTTEGVTTGQMARASGYSLNRIVYAVRKVGARPFRTVGTFRLFDDVTANRVFDKLRDIDQKHARARAAEAQQQQTA